MGLHIANMSTKVLFAALAILAAANAVDVYTSSWGSSNSCSGNPSSSSKITLDQCYQDDGSYKKMTLSGSTYTYGVYSSSSCSGTASTTLTGAADACIVSGSQSAKVTST